MPYAEDEMDVSRISYVLAASDNDYYNALVARELGRAFEYHRTFQVATHAESDNRTRRLGFGSRGSFAFDGRIDFPEFARRYDEGWRFHVTKAGKDFPRESFERALAEAGAVPIGAIDDQGLLRIWAPDQPFRPRRDSRVIYFAPGHVALA